MLIESRVQRARTKLRSAFDACCVIDPAGDAFGTCSLAEDPPTLEAAAERAVEFFRRELVVAATPDDAFALLDDGAHYCLAVLESQATGTRRPAATSLSD